MRRFFAMMRYSKKLLIISICVAIDVLIAIGLCVFNTVQLIEISSNAVKISPLFMIINIILISLMALNLMVVAAVIILKKYKEKRDELKDN